MYVLQLMGLKVPVLSKEIQFPSKRELPSLKAQPSKNIPLQNSSHTPLKLGGGGGSYPEISEDSLLF